VYWGWLCVGSGYWSVCDFGFLVFLIGQCVMCVLRWIMGFYV